MRIFSAVTLLLATVSTALAAPHWTMQYFLDEDKRSLALTSIAFPSAQRGLAAGAIIDQGKEKPVVMVTSNGGSAWTEVAVPEVGHSLFCLDETACWMVTGRGIWFSSEAGRAWKRLYKQEGLVRVHFASRERGWALGALKKLLETSDGGKTWTKVAAAETLKTSIERTVFHAITFLTPRHGLIAARSEPPVRRDEKPLWMDSEAESRKERPTVTALLETQDGGKTWRESTLSMFGRLSKLTIPTAGGKALGLIEYDRFFQYPAEVYLYTFTSRTFLRTLRLKDFAPTDVAVTAAGPGLAVGFQPPGALARSPVPGRVRAFISGDLENWVEMEVDYRAVARRVSLAAVDAKNVWLATDTGMILRLVD